MYVAPSGRAPRACTGIPANAHAKGATSHVQSADHLGGQRRAKAASGLQGVFEAHRGVPPVQHNCGFWQRLALQAP